ncbi:2242_t:CDS:2, partial [Dentiscutata erythropus]
QIVGPDHQIISCDHIEVLNSWLNDWCTFHKLRIILSWLLIFVWFIMSPIYLFTILAILKKRKEKSMQQNEIITYNKSVKEDAINDLKVVTA